MNKTCVYYCEGEDDQKLIDALKVAPGQEKFYQANQRNLMWFKV